MYQLIAIEGPDASGKTTQAALLAAYLKRSHSPVLHLKFPQYESLYGQLIARYLRGELGSLESVSPYLIALVYALDRAQAAGEIKKTLAAGGYVICDRYTPSNIAHHGARLAAREQQAFADFISDLEYQYLKIPREHIVVYLHLDSEPHEALIRNKNNKDMHEEDPVYLKKVSMLYDHLSKTQPHWRAIDCTPEGALLSEEAIHQKIVVALELG